MISRSPTRDLTKADYRRKARAAWVAAPELREIEVAHVSSEHVARLWAALSAHTTSRREIVRMIARAIDFATQRGDRCGENPARGFASSRSRARTRCFDRALPEQLWKALEEGEHTGELPGDFLDFIRFALLQGIRHTEICRLRVRDIDTRAKTINILLKTGRDECLPVSDAALRILEHRIEVVKSGWLWPGESKSRAKGQGWISRKWATVIGILERNGVDVYDRATKEAYSPSVTRSINLWIKTTQAPAEGVAIAAISKSVGHARVQTTARYSPANSEEVRRSVAIVEKMLVKDEKDSREYIAQCDPAMVGARIKAARQNKGITTTQAAAMASLYLGEEIPATRWRGWEKHCDRISVCRIAAAVLRCSPSWVVFGETSP